MWTWQGYVRIAAVILFGQALLATYRDIFDSEYDSVLKYAARLVILGGVSYGLLRRNVWTVRIVSCLSVLMISFLLLFTWGYGAPYPPAGMAMMLASLFPHALLILVPRRALRPDQLDRVTTTEVVDNTNPYAS